MMEYLMTPSTDIYIHGLSGVKDMYLIKRERVKYCGTRVVMNIYRTLSVVIYNHNTPMHKNLKKIFNKYKRFGDISSANINRYQFPFSSLYAKWPHFACLVQAVC